MYVIEITQRHGDRTLRYIAGIFDDVTKRYAAASAIPQVLQGQMKLVNTSCQSYPLYIVEQASGFHYGDRDALGAFIEKTKASLDAAGPSVLEDDEPLFNVYCVTTDYAPGTPGNDEMGLLSHSHVMRSQLEPDQLPGLLESLLY